MGRTPSAEPETSSEEPSPDGQHQVSELSIWQSMRDYPAFRTLFGSTLATNSGFWMWNIAIGWLALILTDSPFFVGLVGFTAGIPTLLFGPFGGVLIDKFSRKTILIIAQTVIAITATVVAALLFLDLLQPWMLLVGGFTNGTSMSLVFPTRGAMVANLITNRRVGRPLASVLVFCMGKTAMCHPLASATFVSQSPVSQSKCQSNTALSCPCLCRAPVGLNLHAGAHVDAPRSPYCDELARSYVLTHCRWETRLATEIGQTLRVGGSLLSMALVLPAWIRKTGTSRLKLEPSVH
jgi:hypothetical protein